MPVFNRADKFSANHQYTRIRWGEDSSIVDSDLTELQKMIRYQMQTMGRHAYSDGYILDIPLTYDASTGNLTVEPNTVVVGGEFIEYTEPMKITVPAGGATVFFATWEQEIKLGDTIKKDGNLSGGSTLSSNGIDPDPIIGGENTRRYQRQLQLVTSSSDPNVRYIPVATFGSDRALVSDDRPRASLVGYVPPDDTAEYGVVGFTPGLQLVEGMHRSTFSLTGLKGRTLVNLLGRNGSLDTGEGVGVYQVLVDMEATDKTQGSASLKVTIDTGMTSGAAYFAQFRFEGGKRYVIVADVKNGNTSSGAYLAIAGASGAQSPKVTAKAWTTTFFRYNPATSITANLDMAIIGGAGQYGYFDAVRVYEIGASEYDAIPSMTPEQIAAKYPYVDSLQPVRNPYVRRYGENMLPSLSEWTVTTQTGDTAVITSPYEMDVSVVSNGVYLKTALGCVGGATYSFKCEVTDDITGGAYIEPSVYYYDKYGTVVGGTGLMPDTKTFTFTPSAATTRIELNIRIMDSTTIKNFMLNLGSEVKPFVPREDAMLALQADLYADPLTGANADEVFEKDGQYFKRAKWKRVLLDGSYGWVYVSPKTGYKCVRMPGLPNSPYFSSATASHLAQAVKYDGKILSLGTVDEGADKFQNSSNGYFYMNISNTDSGWGDNYTPTADEIKAYFMGWRMFNWGVGYDPYNGTGTKGWGKIYRGVGPDDGNGMVAGSGVSTLPTAMNDMGYAPYQLTYKLTKPTVEPITSEGLLTFRDGDNLVEVGSGIVLRESVRPYGNASTGNLKVINYKYDAGGVNTWLKYPLNKFIGIYRNAMIDPAWEIKASNTTAKGLSFAQCQPEKFDDYAAYSVSYMMLETSVVPSVFGTVSLNDKALLYALTEDVQHATEIAQAALNTSQKSPLTEPSGVNFKLSNKADLNKLLTAGFYTVRDPINGPGTLGGDWYVEVRDGGPGYGVRQIADHYTGVIHTRAFDGTKWSRWAPLMASRYRIDNGENLVMNPTGHLGLTGWTPLGGATANWTTVQTAYGSLFRYSGTPHASVEGYLTHATIGVWANSDYTLSADLLNEVTMTEGDFYVEVVTTNGLLLAQISANASGTWERRSVTFSSGTFTELVVRIGIRRGLPAGSYYASNIMLNLGQAEMPYNDRSTDKLLFQQSVDVKSKVAGAVNGLGGTADSSMTGDQLASAITATKKSGTGIINSSPSGSTGSYITYADVTHALPYVTVAPVGGFGFVPDYIILIPDLPNNNQSMQIVTYNTGRTIGSTVAPIQVQEATGAFKSMYKVAGHAIVSSTSFRLPVATHSTLFKWIVGKF